VGEVINVKLNGFVTDANGTKDSRVPSSREASRNAHDHHPGYAVETILKFEKKIPIISLFRFYRTLRFNYIFNINYYNINIAILT
jgi:hypothetical protein